MGIFKEHIGHKLANEHIGHELANLEGILTILNSEEVSKTLKREFKLTQEQISWIKKYSNSMRERYSDFENANFLMPNSLPCDISDYALIFFTCFQLAYSMKINDFQTNIKDRIDDRDRVLVDPIHAYSIISNPISNAVKYGKSKVIISEDFEDNHYILKIINDGNPISPANLRLISNGLETSGGVVSTNKMEVGQGLGLYIAKHLSRLNNVGFEIRQYGNLKGDEFNGTQVTLKFPRVKRTLLDRLNITNNIRETS